MGKLIKQRFPALAIQDQEFFKIRSPIVLGVYFYTMYFIETNQPVDAQAIAEHYGLEVNLVYESLGVLEQLGFIRAGGSDDEHKGLAKAGVGT